MVRSKQNRWFSPLLRWAVVVAAMLWVLFPIYWMIITAFKTRLELFSNPPTLFPRQPTWQNFASAFYLRPFLHFLLNSTVICSVSTLIALAVGSMAAYALARLNLGGRSRDQISFWILSTRMIPPIVIIVPMYLMLRQMGLINTYLGLMIVYTIFNLPFVVWMMQTFFTDVPADLEEAALVDGTTRLGALVRIVLPLVAPGLAATAVFALIVTWNEFIFALILSSTERAITLPVGIAGLVSQFELLWGDMAAAGTVAMIPVVVFALLVQRYLVRGLTLGAVKG